MSIATALTNDHKKILQAKFTLGQEDEFYEITKNDKNKFEYKLKDGYLASLKEHKKKSIENSFGIDNKLSLDFIVNKYIDIEKRLILSEYKRNKDKKKIKRITNDLYETEDNTSNNTINNTQDKPADENFENKLKGIIDEKNTEDKNTEDKNTEDDKSDIQQIDTTFKLAPRKRK
jgi:hypothetical protein